MPVIFHAGVVADSASAASDSVRVSVPNLTQQDRKTYGPVDFNPILSAQGGVLLPQRGDYALLGVDSESSGNAFLSQWHRIDNTAKTTHTIEELSEIVVQIGASIEWNAAGDPPGNRFMVEDGRTLNSIADPTLATLFSRIGVTWGGTGAGDFKIPPSAGRAVVGAGVGAGLVARTVGQLIGTEPSNMPSHTHQYTFAGFSGTALSPSGAFYGVRDLDQTLNTSAAGAGSAVDGNVPPSIVKNKIIRVR